MWQLENGLWKETVFPFSILVTTRRFGNMRDIENRISFCFRHGINPQKLVTAEQVHGNKVALVGAGDAGQQIPGADGFVTNTPGLALAIFTADCVPVFLADKKKRAAGIVHAGWKGLHLGIITEALEMFKKNFDVGPETVSAAIGPHIQKCCYEAGQDLHEKFGLRYDPSHKNLDLSVIALAQLNHLGVRDVSLNGQCTCHESEQFFSYRKDKTTGRMMSLIQI